MKILFLDDDPWRHDLVRAKLEGPDDKIAGIEVIHVWTVEECIHALQNLGPFNWIFLDHDLNDFTKITGKGSRLAGMYGSQELTGRDVTRWIVRNMNLVSNNPKITIHSWNGGAAPHMVEDLREVGLRVSWELFNGGND